MGSMVRVLTPVLVLVLASACQRDEHAYCADQVTELSSLDEQTPLMVVGRDVLAPAEGLHVATMQYAQPGQGTFVDVDPPASTTEVEVEVAYEAGGVRYVESEAVYPERGGTLAALVCFDRVEVDAEMTVRTADGLLDERWPVTLVWRDEDEFEPGGASGTTARVELDLDMLGGTLAVVSVDPPEPDQLWIDLEVDFPWVDPARPEGMPPEPMHGSLGGIAEYDRGEIVEAGFFTISSW